jgi:hypothetical protein
LVHSQPDSALLFPPAKSGKPESMIGHASYIIPSTLYEMFKGQAGASADQ